jgi:MprA protease rhombosortase-interaction domain-containing protein
VYLPLVAAGAGTALRLSAYLHRRSLWFDEAMVAQNIAHRSYRGLTHPLALHQGAPVGWLWAQRTSILAFGENEYAWRLFPLLCGIGVLLATWAVARRLLPKPFVFVPVALAAVNTALIDYSNEAKQYETDAFAAVGLLALTLPLLDRVTPRRLAVWTAAGAVAVWFSHPAVFFAGAYTLAVVVAALLRRNVRDAVLGAAAGAAVAASFAVGYLLIVRHTNDDPVLFQYWRNAHGFPLAGQRRQWVGDALRGFLHTPAGLSPPLWLAVLLLAAGLVTYAVRRPAVPVALAVPAVLLVAAAVAQRYPFAGRLTMGLVPLALVTACGLLAARWRLARVVGLAALLVVARAPADLAVERVEHPREMQEVRQALQYVRAHLQPGDKVVATGHGYAVTAYYAGLLHVPIDATVEHSPEAADCDDRDDLAPAFDGGGRVWLVIAQIAPAQFYDLLARFGEVAERVDADTPTGAWAYAYTARPAVPADVRHRQCLLLETPPPLAR